MVFLKNYEFNVMKYYQLFFFWLFSFGANAGISVSPIVVDLMGKTSDAEIAVKNSDIKHNAYVEITPYRLIHPGDPADKKERVRDPEKDGLLVFPAKLVLLPGQTQFVRVVKAAKELTQDKIYEIDFIPKMVSHVVQKNLPNDGPVVGIRVIVGYGARVTLRPDVLRPSISVKREHHKLIIKNTGNTQLKIVSCTQIVAGKKTELPLPVYTLFAGRKITKELTKVAPVTLDVFVMDKQLGLFHTA